MKILTVEDDPIPRRLLAGILESLGHQVLLAVDGEEGWRRFRLERVDAVITDWRMPHMDGIELTRQIRAHRQERYTYVLLLTSLVGRDRYLDGMQAGADDFVSKPVGREELHARLRVAERILGLQREVRQLQGLLPICSYCRKIRDEQGHWSGIEAYVSRLTEAALSHGICPDCYEIHLRPQLEAAGQRHDSAGKDAV
jgi:DNA-binding response OmpR family regulator